MIAVRAQLCKTLIIIFLANKKRATMTDFVVFDITGADAQKFLQGQVTCNVTKLSDQFQATAISNLKGRVALGFGLEK